MCSKFNAQYLFFSTVPSLWRDPKVIGNYAYVVSEASGHGMQVSLSTVFWNRNIFLPIRHKLELTVLFKLSLYGSRNEINKKATLVTDRKRAHAFEAICSP